MSWLSVFVALWLLVFPAQSAEDWDPSLMDQAVGVEPFGLPVTDPEVLQQTTHDIAAGLRCPVCQGMSVADSNTEAALGMKARVSELVAQGYTPEQIEDYFVLRYSTWILLEPPKQGLNWLVWAGPATLAALGFLGVGLFWMRRRAQVPEPPLPETTYDDPYAQRVLEELDS